MHEEKRAGVEAGKLAGRGCWGKQVGVCGGSSPRALEKHTEMASPSSSSVSSSADNASQAIIQAARNARQAGRALAVSWHWLSKSVQRVQLA